MAKIKAFLLRKIIVCLKKTQHTNQDRKEWKQNFHFCQSQYHGKHADRLTLLQELDASKTCLLTQIVTLF